jgi:hypothetical protein
MYSTPSVVCDGGRMPQEHETSDKERDKTCIKKGETLYQLDAFLFGLI